MHKSSRRRATACRLADARYRFTVGYMPAHLTYPSPHIPVPLALLGAGDDFEGVVEDLLAPSKMTGTLPASAGFLVDGLRRHHYTHRHGTRWPPLLMAWFPEEAAKP